MPLILFACKSSGSALPNQILSLSVSEDNWNRYIKLIDVLILRLENLSDTTMVFPTDFGIQVLTPSDNIWKVFPNNLSYTGSNILMTKSSDPSGLIVPSFPYSSGLSSSTPIRIIIVGQKEDDEKTPVGAYFDMLLKP